MKTRVSFENDLPTVEAALGFVSEHLEDVGPEPTIKVTPVKMADFSGEQMEWVIVFKVRVFGEMES